MHESHASSENTNMQGVHDDEGVSIIFKYYDIEQHPQHAFASQFYIKSFYLCECVMSNSMQM